jgi:hypothetical protein
MGIKVANNAFGTLAASITNSDTSITLTTGQGARFPSLGAGDYFYATLIDTSNNLEIVKCTARSTDVLTVTRAQESTTARSYSAGDRIEIRITAATFEEASAIADGEVTNAKLASGIDAAKITTGDLPLARIATFSSTAPVSPYAGQIWCDTSDYSYYSWNNTTWVALSNIVLDGSSPSAAAQYGSEVITVLGGAFTPGRYWLTGLSSSGQTAQQVYVDADGWMLFYRHAGTGGTYNSTYEIVGDSLGEAAVGTLYSPTQGLTDTGSSTTAGSRGMARLSTAFVRALGGESASGNVIRMTCGSNTVYITDAQWYATAGTAGADIYGYDSSISFGTSYAGRRTYTGSPDPGRPLCTYPNSPYTIPYFHGTTYSGGYDGTWHVATTIWVRQY